MPSRLQGTTRRKATRLLGDSRTELRIVATPQVEVVGPPWGGYTPDLNPELTTFQDALDCEGIVARGGELMLDDGYERIDSARLPLGGASVAGVSHAPATGVSLQFADTNPDTIVRVGGSFVTDGFVAGDVVQPGDSLSNDAFTYTIAVGGVAALTLTLIGGDAVVAEAAKTGTTLTALPPATAGNAEPVTGLFDYLDNSASVRRFAATSNADVGHLYELVSSAWTNRPYENTVAASASITGNSTTPERTLFDWAYYPLGDFMVFTNDLDNVYRFPDPQTAAAYTEFNTSSGAGATTPHQFNGGNESFVARSVASYGDRLVFLNVIEGATATGDFPFRLAWTNISSVPTLDRTVTGAGFIDLIDVEGEGLKVLPLGNDALACYFEKGVVLVRRHFIATQAFTREFVTAGRGLLSTFSVVDLGSGVHFGIFNDGWFFFDATGRWIEAGVRNINGKTNHKFKETFYNLLNFDNRARVTLGLDRTNRFVRISFPSGDSIVVGTNINPDVVWIYDIEQDAVWPDAYGANTPNMWATFDDQVSDQDWDTFPGAWSGTDATWDSFGFRTGRERPVHGTVGGLVFRHAQDLLLKDVTIPTYRWETHARHLGLPGLVKNTDRLHVGYTRLVDNDGNDPPAITYKLKTESTLIEAAVQQTKGIEGELQVDFADGRRTGNRLGFGFSGQAPVRTNGFQFQYFIHGTQEKKD